MSENIENLPQKKRRVRFSTEVMFIVSVVFCVSLSFIYLSRYYSIRNLLNREEEQKARIEELERENRKLKMNLENLSTPEGIERLARERLGLVKPDEIVVVPLNGNSATHSQNVTYENKQPR
ncbi:MAG: cell division protein FtsL [Candidatus Riflebacteria bacterium]|nr:cell division protein FtsL [Candidatus Riflebacteria bacterium]